MAPVASTKDPALKPHIVLAQLFVLVALTSCNADVPSVDKEETVILTSDSVVLSESPVRLSSANSARVVGGEVSVCVVVGENIVDGDTDDRMAIYNSILGDNEIFGAFHLTNGTSVNLVSGSYSWARTGELVENGELSSCLRPPPDQSLAVGTEIDWVELGATGPIEAIGVYIYSTNGWDF